MASPPASSPPQRFSQSSRVALGWALERASARGAGSADAMTKSNMMQKEGGQGGERVTVPDLLVGILLAKGDDSEPWLLLRYAGADEALLHSALEPTGFTPADPSGEPYDGLAVEDMFRQRADPDAAAALDHAIHLAQSQGPDPDLVRLRDLFGGLLLGSSEGPALLARALEGAPVTVDQVASVYPDYVSQRQPGSSRLDAFLAERFPTQSAPQEPARVFRVASMDADRTGTEDLVGIGAEVDAFAYLIAAPTLHPPLAVGLFGDWGSGKSFFMDSLRRRIDELTAAARTSPLPQARLPVFRHIAQIEFNAWHYVEGNLWASLVEHIFQTLSGAGDPDDPAHVEEKLRLWSMELESQRVARSQVDTRLVRLREERQAREAELARAREARMAKLQALQQTRATDALAAVSLNPDLQGEIAELLERVGLSGVRASALETKEALNDARVVLQQGSALLSPLRRDGIRGWTWALVLVAVALSGPAVSWALDRIPDQPLDAVTRALTGIATFLSAVALTLRVGSQWLSTSLRGVESAQARIEEIRAKKSEEMAGEEAGLLHDLDVLDEEVGRLAHRKAAIDTRIETIEAELKNLTPARLISDFIDERVGSEDYRKHLGVPALIRRDFRRLSRLVETQNSRLMAGEEPEGSADTDSGEMVNRVVLYIDDLDRCPPARVVEVLQAVHLLLAFELFVVVVAVDSRWLSRSLVSHYQTLLNGEAAAGGGGPGATADDYLEKIFQIPFHVRPLTETGRGRILQGLLGMDSRDAPGPGGQLTSDMDSRGASRGGTVPENPALAQRPEPREDTPDSGGGRLSSVRTASAHAAPRTPDLNPERLRIGPHELAFMETLRPLLGRTPRAVKRFVNVYRLLAAIAQARGLPMETGEDIPPYRVAMFLLAVVTGLPEMAPAVLSFARRGARAAETGQREAEQMTLEWVMQQYTSGALHYRPEGPSPEYRALRAWLDTTDEGAWKTLPLTRLSPWMDVVSRFSFRTEVGSGE